MPRKFIKRTRRFKKKSKMPFTRRQAKAIKKLSVASSELKVKEDLANNLGSFTDSAPFQYSMNTMALAQGTDDDERIGDKIKVKNITYKLRIKPGSAGYNTTDGHMYRVCAVQTYDADAITAAVIPNPLENWPDYQTSNVKYKVLYNKVITLNPDVSNSKYHIINIQGKRLREIIFDNALTTLQTNHIDLFIKPLTTVNNQLQADYSVKLSYYDN